MPPTNGRGSSVSNRARHLSSVDAQDGLFDQEIDDTSLEALLDEREDLNEKRLEANRKFKEKHDLVKARLGEFNIAVGEVARVGKYRIEKRPSQGGHREFDVAPGERLTIKLFDQ
jgi:hypothetical protein